MTTPSDSPLGKKVASGGDYDPGLLFGISRASLRAPSGIADPPPFHGVDIWNAYEFSWLDARGKPQVALAEFRVSADSPNLIESKSFKLYLNSWAQRALAAGHSPEPQLSRDLSAVAGAPVQVSLALASAFPDLHFEPLQGQLIDLLDIDIDNYGPPQPEYLDVIGEDTVLETLVSHLLKSNCPVTGQPDWASVQIRYSGRPIEREGLLRYLVSFRDHSDFHEACVERIFMDLLVRCGPQRLEVYARYTRRGGLDINPWRGTSFRDPGNPRGPRQ